MPNFCKKCNEKVPSQKKINGKMRRFGNRKYCLKCSPFNNHNTKSLEVESSTKACNLCKKTKNISEYYLKPNGYTYERCKKCLNSKRVQHFRDNKCKAVEYKGGKCEHCGYDKCNSALEFHHKDPNEKDISLAKYRKVGIESFKPELDKCILLCANCHREEHYRLFRS
jgi:hypothetical protein